jgi:hypothetical protein
MAGKRSLRIENRAASWAGETIGHIRFLIYQGIPRNEYAGPVLAVPRCDLGVRDWNKSRDEKSLLARSCSFDCVHRRLEMARGDKSSYTDKQKRMAEHIEEGYESRGVGHDEAERRAWATVNKETGGGKKSGSGRGHAVSHASSRRGGEKASQSRTSEERSRAAKKGWETRRKRSASK